jgi:hypothetical protein
MNNKWKWGLGIAIAVIILLVPLLAQIFFPNGAYRMMNYGYGWHMPMMSVGGMMGFGMMLIVWLILLSFLVLIVLGIAWLVKTLTATK